MNKELITSRDLRHNLARWQNMSPKRFRTQPPACILIHIFRELDELNRAAKDINFPLRKSPFYKIKSALIRWVILQVKYKTRDDVSYKINSQETDGWAEYVNLDINIGDYTFTFHQKIETPLRWVIWDELVSEATPFMHDTTPSTLAHEDVISTWKSLLQKLENSTWFCFDDCYPQDWIRILKYRYNKAFDYGRGGFKLSVALSGGPKLTFANGYVCTVGQLYSDFHYYAAKGDILGKFSLDTK